MLLKQIDRLANNIGTAITVAALAFSTWSIISLYRAIQADHLYEPPEDSGWPHYETYVPSDWEDDWDATHLN